MLRFLDCRKIDAWTIPYLTGDLEPEARRAEFERHVQACDRCKERVRERKALLTELLEADPPPSDLKAALDELGVSKGPSAVVRWGLAAALVIVLVGSAYVWRLANPVDRLLGERASTLPEAQEKQEPKSSPSPYVNLPDAPKEPPVEVKKETPPPEKPAPAKTVPKPPAKPQPKAKRPAAQPKPPEKKPQVTEVEILDASGRVVGRGGRRLNEE